LFSLDPKAVLETIRALPLGLWLGLGGGVAFALIYISATRRHGLQLIGRWAELNRFEIVTAKRRAFVPFGGQWKGVSCFRVRVRHAIEGTKDCWLRFRDWAQDPNEIEVFWDAKV
jgi:hypothetical protein